MLPKATGKLTNINPGPALDSIPGFTKTIEKITSPAINATKVSKIPTINTLGKTRLSSGM